MLKIQVQVGSVSEADLLRKFMFIVQGHAAYKVVNGGVAYAPDKDSAPGKPAYTDRLGWDDFYSLTPDQFAFLSEDTPLTDFVVRLELNTEETTIADLVHFGDVLKLKVGVLEYCQSCRRLLVECQEEQADIADRNEAAGNPVPWDESAMKGSMD